MVATRSPVDRRQLTVHVGRATVVARQLGDASRRGERRDRIGVFLECVINRFGRIRPTAVSFAIASQQLPLFGRGIGVAMHLPGEGIDFRVESLAGAVDLDSLGDGRILLFDIGGQTLRDPNESKRLVELTGAGVIIRRFQMQSEVLRIELARCGDLRDRFIEIPKAVVDLGQTSHVDRRVPLAFRDRGPGGERLLGPLQDVIELAEILAILRVVRCLRDGFLIQREGFVLHIRLAKQVGYLSHGEGVIGSRVQDLLPDARGFGLAGVLIKFLVLEDQLSPVAQEVRVAGRGLDQQFVLLDRFRVALIVD